MFVQSGQQIQGSGFQHSPTISPAGSQLVSSRDILPELHSASKDVGSSRSCRRRLGEAGC